MNIKERPVGQGVKGKIPKGLTVDQSRN